MTLYQMIWLAVWLTFTIGGIVAGVVKWGLRSELRRRESESDAADALLKQRQDSLAERVNDAHKRIDGMQENMKHLIHREDYVPQMTIITQKLDALSEAIARLEERIKK